MSSLASDNGTDPTEHVSGMAAELTGEDNVPGASPSDRRRKRVREAIILAAEQVFAAEGAQGLSIRRLAEAVDYSPAALYKYFPSKGAVIAALKEAFFEKLVGRMEDPAALAGDAIGNLRRAFITYVEIGVSHPNHYAAAFASKGEDDFVTPAEECNNSEKAYQFLLARVEHGVRSRQLADINPVYASLSLWASMHGLTMLMVSLPRFPEFADPELQISRRQFIEYHADLALRGLAACTAPVPIAPPRQG